MASQNLFQLAQQADSVQGGNAPLIEFKAGKMHMVGNEVKPDQRRGSVSIIQSVDGLMHLYWKDRTTGATEDDLVIFPDEVHFKRLRPIKSGRVFVLRFKATGRKLFFWLQEPSDAKDDEIETNVNKFLNDPPAAGGSDPANIGGMNPNSMMDFLQQQPQGQGLFGVPQSPVPSASAANPPGAPSRVSNPMSSGPANNSPIPDLSSIFGGLSGIQVPANQRPQQQQPVNEGPNLSSVLNPDDVTPILNDENIQQALYPHLPEEHRNPQQLAYLLRSPQFQQTVAQFNAAMQSGELGELLRQFELDPSIGGTEGLLDAIQKQADKEKEDK